MSRRIPSKVAALSAVAATALILDPTCSTSSSCCAYAFTPTSSTTSSLRTTSGPLHLLNDCSRDSLVPQNSLQSMDRRIMASSSMRIPPTSSSSNLVVASRRDRMALYAAKNKGGEIDYANMKPQVYPQRWVQLAYLSLLALLVSFSCTTCARNLLMYDTC